MTELPQAQVARRQKQLFFLVFVSSILIIYTYKISSGLPPMAVLYSVPVYFYPLLVNIFVIALLCLLPYQSIIPYLIFFSISVTSFLGITKTLTGLQSESINAFLFGLPFYSAYLAYKLLKRDISWRDTFVASNPLLLFTGPVAIFFRPIRYSAIHRRLNQYFPFMVIGVFFFKIIASPLTKFLPMLALTDVGNSVTFAFIYELFVYFNFAGLSLIIYAVFGILGIKIPLNFRQPFSSRNLVEYWKGWHLSLSGVLKELFYSPIRKKTGTTVAVFCVFISSALWHGMTLNFVMWGVFHALFYILSIALLKRNYKYVVTVLMLFAIVVGRLLFSDSDTDRLLLKLMPFNGASPDFSLFKKIPITSYLSLMLAVIVVSAEFVFAKKKYFRERSYKFLRIPIIQLTLVALAVVMVSATAGVDYAVYGQR